jgi:hypothetical protein
MVRPRYQTPTTIPTYNLSFPNILDKPMKCTSFSTLQSFRPSHYNFGDLKHAIQEVSDIYGSSNSSWYNRVSKNPPSLTPRETYLKQFFLLSSSLPQGNPRKIVHQNPSRIHRIHNVTRFNVSLSHTQYPRAINNDSMND